MGYPTNLRPCLAARAVQRGRLSRVGGGARWHFLRGGGALTQGNLGDPPASPDGATIQTLAFTLPSGGRLWIRDQQISIFSNCASAQLGLYVDGVPVPDSLIELPNSGTGEPLEINAIAQVGAGPHTVTARVDCPGGPDGGVSTDSGRALSVVLLGG